MNRWGAFRVTHATHLAASRALPSLDLQASALVKIWGLVAGWAAMAMHRLPDAASGMKTWGDLRVTHALHFADSRLSATCALHCALFRRVLGAGGGAGAAGGWTVLAWQRWPAGLWGSNRWGVLRVTHATHLAAFRRSLTCALHWAAFRRVRGAWGTAAGFGAGRVWIFTC